MPPAHNFNPFLMLICLHSAVCLNTRPIVGILAVPAFGNPNATSHIPASYVKMVESGGARVVPIPLSLSDAQHIHLFNSINALFIPGGGPNDVFSRIALFYYNKAVAAHQAGDYFPIWGTCLGFETLAEIASGMGFSEMTKCDGEGMLLPIVPTPSFDDSRLFGPMDSALKLSLQQQAIEPNSHQWCLTPDKFNSPKAKIGHVFKSLATSKTPLGTEFVAAMEGISLPFYGIQWHPEKNVFEWSNRTQLSRSDAGVELVSYLARFVVKEAQKSNHRFTNASEEDLALIYNYNPKYTGMNNGYFEQDYLFA